MKTCVPSAATDKITSSQSFSVDKIHFEYSRYVFFVTHFLPFYHREEKLMATFE